MASGTDLGREVESVVNAGELVSDDLMIELIRERLADADTDAGFILDGFPRTTVQAGALTAAIDRPLPTDHPEVRDYERAAGFRRLAAELGEDPAILAHRYALSLDIDTLVLGVKNRQELAGCVAAAEAGPLSQELIDRIDRVVQRTAAP